MSSDISPLQAWDITPDGTAQPAADHGPVPPAGTYRWLHLDLADPGLRGWVATHLPPYASRSLLVARTRPRVETEGDDAIALTLRGINLNPGEDTTDMVSLRLWVTPHLIVTVRRQRFFVMEDIAAMVRAGDAPRSPAHMIARITESSIDRIERYSLDLDDKADGAEDEVYDHNRPPAIPLAPLRRTAIKLRRHVGPLADALTELAEAETRVIPRDLRNRMRDTAARCRRSLDELSEVHDRLTALADHIDMIQDQRLARNGYMISVAAAIFLPLSFLTGLFGVNVGGMPGIDHPMAFAILCIAMVVLGLLIYAIFRLMKLF